MRRWYPLVLVTAAFAVAGLAYGRLPAQLPVHWNADWRPDGWARRGVGAFGPPALMLILWGTLRGLPAVDPRRDNYAKFSSSYDLIVAATLTLVFVLHTATLGTALGFPIPLRRVLPAALGIYLMAVGNVLPRVRSNWFVGVRTPWALSDDRVWARTQRLAGYALVGAGGLFILASAVPAHWTSTAARVATGGAALAVIVSSVLRSTRA